MINNSTFTRALLDKLARGIAKTSILPVVNGSVALKTLDFSTAGLLYSVEDSLNLDWPEPTLEEIRVDQGLATIAMDVDKGDIAFSANYPAIAEVALKEFFKEGYASTITAPDGTRYAGTSIFIEPKTTEVSVLIEDMDQQYSITMARVALTARLAYDPDKKLWYIGLNGRVLANLADNEADVLVGAKVALDAPTISGTTPFTTNTSVTITGPQGATIYYTTDGSDPTTSSNQYSTAISLSSTSTVKAIAVKDGISSAVASKTFTKS